jgi:hypothetical protein
MQQVVGMFQCFDVSLNAYLDKCLEIIALYDDFTIYHISRDENTVVNDLAQQASGFDQIEENLFFLKKPDVPVCQTEQSGLQSMCSATICSAEPSSANLDSPVSETRGSRISRISDESSKMMMANPDDWRTLLVYYLQNPGHIGDRKIQRQALKYVMLDSTLYR